MLSCYSRGDSAPAGELSELSAAARAIATVLERSRPPEPLSEPELDSSAQARGGPGSGAGAARRPEAVFEYSNLAGASSAMRQVYEEIAQVARTNATTLIRGESGTGKELVASAIHHNSDRALEPLVKVNCAALPEALFESELFGHERGALHDGHGGVPTVRSGRARGAAPGVGPEPATGADHPGIHGVSDQPMRRRSRTSSSKQNSTSYRHPCSKLPWGSREPRFSLIAPLRRQMVIPARAFKNLRSLPLSVLRSRRGSGQATCNLIAWSANSSTLPELLERDER